MITLPPKLELLGADTVAERLLTFPKPGVHELTDEFSGTGIAKHFDVMADFLLLNVGRPGSYDAARRKTFVDCGIVSVACLLESDHLPLEIRSKTEKVMRMRAFPVNVAREDEDERFNVVSAMASAALGEHSETEAIQSILDLDFTYLCHGSDALSEVALAGFGLGVYQLGEAYERVASHAFAEQAKQEAAITDWAVVDSWA